MKPPRFPRFLVGTPSSLAVITAGACALVFVSSASAVDVLHTLSNTGASTWTGGTWSNGVPDAVGDIAAYSTAATTPTTSLNTSGNITLGSLLMTAGTSWAITPAVSQAIIFDATGMSSANNGFGNAGVASIRNLSGGSNLAPRLSMILDNTDLDVGIVLGSSGTPQINIGSTTLNTHSITNADATDHTITFRLNATATTNQTVAVNSTIGGAGTGGGGSIHLNNASTGGTGAVTLAGNLGSLVGNITQNSSNVRMLLTGTNTNTGNIAVNAGTLIVTNRVSLYNGNASLWNSSKITVDPNATLALGFGGAAKFTASELATLNASSIFVANSRFGIEVTGSENHTYANAITDGNGGANSIAFVKQGAGTLAVSGASTYTGGTIISNGTLSLLGAQGATNGPLGASSGGLPTGSILFNGGTLQFTATNTTDYSSRFSTAASNAIRIDTNSQTVTFASAMTSSGGTLFKTGTGTLILTGANTYTGTTDVSQGTLRGSDSTVYTNATNTLTKVLSSGVVQIANNATLDLRANGLNDSSVQTLTYGNQIQVSTSNTTYNINVGRESGTGTNKIIAMGNHNVGANAVMNLTGDPGYQLSINQYQIGGGTAASTTILNPTTGSLIIGSVGGGSNTLSPTMNLDGTSSGNVITGVIANNATPGLTGTAVLKTNTSTWSLNGTNTYTGATTVNGGNLFVNGSIAANSAGVSVGANGTLGGTGTINTTVSVTGNLAAGNISSSIGDLKVGSVNSTAALNFSSGGTYIWQMGALADDTTGTAGTHFDQISLTGSGGNLVLGGTSKLMLDFAALGSDPNSADPFWLASHSWTVIDGEAGVTNTGSTNFNQVLNSNFTTGSFATTADALGNVTLVFTPIPEPATAALLLGSLGLLARRRRN